MTKVSLAWMICNVSSCKHMMRRALNLRQKKLTENCLNLLTLKTLQIYIYIYINIEYCQMRTVFMSKNF